MSRKNHEMIDGKLLQTDKKYAQLKLKQKEKIAGKRLIFRYDRKIPDYFSVAGAP